MTNVKRWHRTYILILEARHPATLFLHTELCNFAPDISFYVQQEVGVRSKFDQSFLDTYPLPGGEFLTRPNPIWTICKEKVVVLPRGSAVWFLWRHKTET